MQSFDVTVLGSGPGGYVAAIRASQLGMKVAMVEKESLGGVCLNWGCIPTKALLRIAEQYEFLKESERWGFQVENPKVAWDQVIRRSRDAAGKLNKGVGMLMKKNRITVLDGHARFLTPGRLEIQAADGRKTAVSTSRSIIATGARAATIPGVSVDGKRVISSREAMVLGSVPASITIIGAGAIGLEFAYFYSVFGTEITIVEYLDRLLPTADEDLSAQLTRAFKKRGMKIHTSSRVTSVDVGKTGTRTTFEQDGKDVTVESEATLMAVGVRGNVEDMGLEGIGVPVERGFIQVDEHLRTGIANVYAIGDVRGQPALAHVASAEGVHAVEHLAGLEPRPIDYSAIPACVYCQPQVASVGLTEKEAREKGYDVKVGRFPFAANGKAVAVGETEGFVKIVGDAKFGEILGAHIIGSEATELIAEMALARAAELTVHDVHTAIHSHPTLSESLMEAAADWTGAAIQV
jgi:dihydrolipoamide dehydrogenase